MKDHLFLYIQKSNQRDYGGASLLCFPHMEAADCYIREWLENSCGLECYQGEAEAAQLQQEHGGVLPELSFACPRLTSPSDLEAYNGYYSFGFAGTVSLFVMPVYDEASAQRLMRDAIREFDLDQVLSEEADKMIEMLELLRESFLRSVDYQHALEKVDRLFRDNGLPLF